MSLSFLVTSKAIPPPPHTRMLALSGLISALIVVFLLLLQHDGGCCMMQYVALHVHMQLGVDKHKTCDQQCSL